MGKKKHRVDIWPVAHDAALGCMYPILECLYFEFQFHSLFQLLYSQGAGDDSSKKGPCHPSRQPGLNSWILASTSHNPACCSHLGNELADGISLSLSLSTSQESKNYKST